MTLARPPRTSWRVLISSGPTREPLDPVRFLSNYSTGVMGACLAREALRRGHRVTVVSGPTDTPLPAGASVVRVERARQMQVALRRRWPRHDVLIMAAAVCDFEPVRVAERKLARQGTTTLRLRATPDIVGTLPRRSGQIVVGFALETERGFARAHKKLRAKRLDLIVGQHLNGHRPFGAHPVQAFLLPRVGDARNLGVVSKPRLAKALFDELEFEQTQ